MKWIFVWWLIHPGHSQVIHREEFQSEESCRKVEAMYSDGQHRHHCSVE
jgi:hypothetical protein